MQRASDGAPAEDEFGALVYGYRMYVKHLNDRMQAENLFTLLEMPPPWKVPPRGVYPLRPRLPPLLAPECQNVNNCLIIGRSAIFG